MTDTSADGLREADIQAINKICDVFPMDEALKLFDERVAEHERALLDSLLYSSKDMTEKSGNFDEFGWEKAVPASVIQAKRKELS